jgi:hypothetical protein
VGGAFGHASARDVSDAAHGAGHPPVVKLQCLAEVGSLAAVRAVPLGGERG